MNEALNETLCRGHTETQRRSLVRRFRVVVRHPTRATEPATVVMPQMQAATTLITWRANRGSACGVFVERWSPGVGSLLPRFLDPNSFIPTSLVPRSLVPTSLIPFRLVPRPTFVERPRFPGRFLRRRFLRARGSRSLERELWHETCLLVSPFSVRSNSWIGRYPCICFCRLWCCL